VVLRDTRSGSRFIMGADGRLVPERVGEVTNDDDCCARSRLAIVIAAWIVILRA
jgi:hypothetical protein